MLCGETCVQNVERVEFESETLCYRAGQNIEARQPWEPAKRVTCSCVRVREDPPLKKK